jgi:hypothetical protein
MINNMPSSSNLILGILGEMFRKFTPRSKDSNDIVVVLLVVAILFVIATTPFKILLRKNFGTKAISILDIVMGAMFFAVWSIIAMFILANHYEYSKDTLYEAYFFNKYVLFAIAAIFVSITLNTLIKGFREESRNKFQMNDNWINDNYRGDSIMFQKHVTNNKMQLRVWKNIEPGFCFKWSFFLLIIHPLLGFPLFFASIAFWINEYYHVTYKWEKLSQHENNTYSNKDYEDTDYVVAE